MTVRESPDRFEATLVTTGADDQCAISETDGTGAHGFFTTAV